MKVAHHAEIEYDSWPGIRGENALHRTLLQGNKNTPLNFEYGIVTFKNDGNGSPRHKHVFDQFRYAIEGEIEYDPGKTIPQGCLAYFPEGVYYGPFKIHPRTVFLSCQFGGPSGQGFVHRQDLGVAREALAKEGTFEFGQDKGVYVWTDKDGKTHREDSHKAVWQRATGAKEVHMPAPRYDVPILIYPEAYRWVDIGPKVAEKTLGVFNERNTYAKMVKIEKGGTWTRPAEGQKSLNFVVEGAVSLNGSEVCQKHDAFQCEPDESVQVTAMADAMLLIYGMPKFD